MKKGFTLLEVLVTVALIAVLSALLLGAASKVMSSASQTECVHRLRQIGVAIGLYAADNDQKLPTQPVTASNYQNPNSWMNQLFPYTGSYTLMACPVSPRQKERPANSYLFNAYVTLTSNPTGLEVVKLTMSREPSRDVLIVDGYSRSGNNSRVDGSAQKVPITETDPSRFPHPNVPAAKLPADARRGILFVDGHAEMRGLEGGEIKVENWQWPQQ